MIIEYHRPKKLDEAVALIARPAPRTVPLGGGTVLNRPGREPVAVVDLQALGLNTLRKAGKELHIGATVSLQALADFPDLPEALIRALKLEANYNLRQLATVAGTLVACDGRSAFATVLLALDAHLILLPGEEEIGLGNLLPVREETLRGRLITQITIPLQAKLAFETVARTPADRPLVCAALTQWASGRTRLSLGGTGKAPLLAMDGNEPGGIEAAAREAFSGAADEWATAEYRAVTAATLAKRCLDILQPA
jgi:CO/xanthine dehydrogenase FAD-binding subunit